MRICVCVPQVSQVVQKTPAQPRAGEATAGRAGGGDGGAQRRQPRRAGHTDRPVVGVRQPGDQHERGGVHGAGALVGCRAAKDSRRRHDRVTVVAVQHTTVERSTDGHGRSRGRGRHSRGRRRRRGGGSSRVGSHRQQ